MGGNRIHNAVSHSWLLAMLALAVLLPVDAHASATTVGDLMKNTANDFGNLIPLFAAVCYLAGAIMTVQLILALQSYAEKRDKKLTGIAWRGVGTAAMLSFPSFAGSMVEMVFGKANPTTLTMKSKLTGVNSSVGLDASLISFLQDVGLPLIAVIGFIAFCSGLLMIGSALVNLSNINYGQDNTPKGAIVAKLLVGAALVAFGPSVKGILQSVYGSGDAIGTATLAYNMQALATVNAATVNSIFNAIFFWVQIVGLMAILRGFWVLKSNFEGKGGSLTAPLTHLIAGAMLANIVPTINLIQNTFKFPQLVTIT